MSYKNFRCVNFAVLAVCALVGWLGSSCDSSEVLSVGVTDAEISAADGIWVVLDRALLVKVSSDGSSVQNGKFGGAEINGVDFLTSEVGWVVTSSNQVWKTIDGGESWRLVGSYSSKYTGLNKQIAFGSERDGWILELMSVWRTGDGGVSWERMPPLIEDNSPREPVRVVGTEDGNCFVGTTSGSLYVMSEGDPAWKKLNSPVAVDLDVMLFRGNEGWVATSVKAGLYRTSDGGVTWRPALSNDLADAVRVKDIAYLNDGTVWAAGSIKKTREDGSLTWSGILLRSADAGTTWQVISVETNESEFTKIAFPETGHGVVVGPETVLQSEDAGESWGRALKIRP